MTSLEAGSSGQRPKSMPSAGRAIQRRNMQSACTASRPPGREEITEAAGESGLVEARKDVLRKALEHRPDVRVGGPVMREEGFPQAPETQDEIFDQIEELGQVRSTHPPVSQRREAGGLFRRVELLGEIRRRRAGNLQNLGDGGVDGLYVAEGQEADKRATTSRSSGIRNCAHT
jgi:hypothetical protein